MKKRFLIFLALFLMLIVSIVYAAPPVKPDDYDCYMWRFASDCTFYNDGGWNLKDYGRGDADPDEDGRLNSQECLEGSKPDDIVLPDQTILGIDSDKDTTEEGSDNLPPNDLCPVQEEENGTAYDPSKGTPNYFTSAGFTINRVFPCGTDAQVIYTEDQQKYIFDCINERSEALYFKKIADICKVLLNEKDQPRRQLTAMWSGICQGFVCAKCGVAVSELPEAETIMNVIEFCENAIINGGSQEDLNTCYTVLDRLNNGLDYADAYNIKPGAALCFECSETPNPAGSSMTTSSTETITTTQNTSPWSKFMNWVLSFF